MNRVGLEAIIAERKKLPKRVVSAVLQEMQEVVLERLRHREDVRMIGFGVFFVREQKERLGKNPKTGVPIRIPARLKPAFHAGKNLIAALNLPVRRGKEKRAAKRQTI